MSKYLDSGGLSHFWSKIKLLFEIKSNKVTEITETSTDTEYPSAKAVYDLVGASGGSLKIATGTIKNESSKSISLDFTPVAVLIMDANGTSNTFNIAYAPRLALIGQPHMYYMSNSSTWYTVLTIVDNGFECSYLNGHIWNYVAIGT